MPSFEARFSAAPRPPVDLSRRGRRRRGLGCAALLLLPWLLVPLMFESILRTMLYPAPPVAVPAPPTGLREHALPAADGTALVAWAGPAAEPAAGRPAVLLFHGNGENLATMERSGLFARLDRVGVAYLAVDYPGYGRSGGTPGEESLVAGAEAGLDRLRRLHPDRPAVVLGWSLGAAVAVQLAAHRPEEVDGLVLLSPWSRLSEVAAVHFPAPLAAPLVGNRYDSLAAVSRVRAPALVIHGERDRIIPFAQGEAVATALAARSGVDTRWVPVAPAGHNDLLAEELPWREMAAFFDRLAGD